MTTTLTSSKREAQYEKMTENDRYNNWEKDSARAHPKTCVCVLDRAPAPAQTPTKLKVGRSPLLSLIGKRE